MWTYVLVGRYLYSYFCVIPQRLNFICRCFGKLCLCHFIGCISRKKFFLLTPPMKMEQTECSETLEYKI